VDVPATYVRLIPWVDQTLNSAQKVVPEHLRAEYRQDVWVELLRVQFLSRIEPNRDFKAYLFLTIRNITSNWIRSHSRHWGKVTVLDPGDPVFGFEDPGSELVVLDAAVERHLASPRPVVEPPSVWPLPRPVLYARAVPHYEPQQLSSLDPPRSHILRERLARMKTKLNLVIPPSSELERHLPPVEQRLLAGLREGLVQRELGMELGITQAAVSYRVTKAIDRLGLLEQFPRIPSDQLLEQLGSLGYRGKQLVALERLYHSTCQTTASLESGIRQSGVRTLLKNTIRQLQDRPDLGELARALEMIQNNPRFLHEQPSPASKGQGTRRQRVQKQRKARLALQEFSLRLHQLARASV
jgi:RNA polymerase sigma factor (sigma-70 family)